MSVCVLAQPIDASGVRLLRDAGIEVLEAASPDPGVLVPLLADAVAVIVRNKGLPSAAMAAAPRLAVIGVHGTGTDAVDMETARERGIRVVNTPGTNAQSVAEHALGLMLAAARMTPAADRATRSGDFGYRERARGVELHGRRLGLWGYGRIAHALGTLGRALGMDVDVLSRHAGEEELARHGFRKVPTLDALLAGADVLSLHGLPEGRALIGAAEFARMRPGAILVNTARGALIDENALVDALGSGHLRGAALDVFTEEPLPAASPLCACPNLILTPHIGGSTQEALERTSLAVAEAVLRELGRAG
ncbi:hydroxyacid dehydrogenase [Aureimonas populi]|uniref:Hydroxyacid dehydrogenase n=1 Tax=Aureimonas populi TaxID=1701758 RepID=A0ABW5CLQ9_9HYPH|nr:hydroxyacid dehydrogenase [Aureimonas populi]